MQKRTSIILSTVLCWRLIVVLYAYRFVSAGMRHPSSLDRVPIDPEAVALDRIWWIHLIWFALTRFPFLLGALFLVLVIERKLLRSEE